MKRSTHKGKKPRSFAKSRTKKTTTTAKNLEGQYLKSKFSKKEVDGLIGDDQPLLYMGPPPAIRSLKGKNEYDKDFHPQDLLKHMQEGSTKSEVCAAWGITYTTFNDWIDKFPELSSAYAVGRPAYDAYYKRTLRHSAFGQILKVRENSLFYMLKNVAGFSDDGGDHEYNEGSSSELEFVDDND